MNPLLKFNVNNTEYKPNVFYSNDLGCFVVRDVNGKVCILDKGGDRLYYRTQLLDASVITNVSFTWDTGASGHIEFKINYSGYISGIITFRYVSQGTEYTINYKFEPYNAPENVYDTITNNSPSTVYRTEEFQAIGVHPSPSISSYLLYQYELWGGQLKPHLLILNHAELSSATRR